MLYLVKHWLEALLSPLSVSFSIVVIAVACRLTRRVRLACALLMVAATVVYVGSIGVVGDALLGPLEHRYPPLRLESPLPAVGYVVVLGGGYAPHDGVPTTAALNADSLARVVEGVRLVRSLNAARLVVSGGAPSGQSASAHGYAEMARELGVPEGSLILVDTPLDTGAEARSVAALVAASPFILVTSAYHMPRAMLEMRHAGLAPIAAPTGQLVGGPSGADLRDWLPSSNALRKVERALHEYVGLAVLAMSRG
jgi:uncharacterized SAM-binding protein YcdF (DUF218 family)